MRDLTEIFGALADETRLRMLALLFENHELCVCDFVSALQITQSKASRHLRTLRASGLFEDRKDGLWVHYRLSPAINPDRRAIVGALKRILTRRDLEQLRSRLRTWLKHRMAEEICEKPPSRRPLPRRAR